MKTELVCPDCGNPLDIDNIAETETATFYPNPGGMPYLERGTRPAMVAFCNGCEFAVEVR